MVGMNMGISSVPNCQTQFSNERSITFVLFENWVNDDGFMARLTT